MRFLKNELTKDSNLEFNYFIKTLGFVSFKKGYI